MTDLQTALQALEAFHSQHGSALDEMDRLGIEDVILSLEASVEREEEDLVFDGTIPVTKPERRIKAELGIR